MNEKNFILPPPPAAVPHACIACRIMTASSSMPHCENCVRNAKEWSARITEQINRFERYFHVEFFRTEGDDHSNDRDTSTFQAAQHDTDFDFEDVSDDDRDTIPDFLAAPLLCDDVMDVSSPFHDIRSLEEKDRDDVMESIKSLLAGENK